MLVKAPNDTSASLSQDELQRLKNATAQYSPLQLAWASGYLAAKSEQGGSNDNSIGSVAKPAGKLTILFGSQTGNAKAVAQKVAADASSRGIKADLVNMADYKPKSLKSETHLIVITSTNGEGEPPDDALALHEFLGSKRAPKLASLQYSVLALGDSSYEFFCQTGKDFDQKLSALGAKAVIERIDCDVDYQQQVANWQQKSLDLFAEDLSSPSADVVQLPLDGQLNSTSVSEYSKEKPFLATVLENQKITGRDSNKVVHHVEIDLTDSGLTYQVGDALGIWPKNDNGLAQALATLLSLDLQAQVELAGEKLSLTQALVEKLEITALAKQTLQAWLAHANSEELNAISNDGDTLRQYLNRYQLIDLLTQYPGKVSEQAFVDLLPALTPRLYSIASSQQEVEEEVHLTVGLLNFESDGEARTGCASGYLIERLNADDEIDVFIEHNNNFRLPDNTDTPIIMVGPGTGVAPFRAFMQEREATGAEGENWLFFGDQTFTQDFLYQVEWQGYVKSGLLTKLDVAFSRDQVEKVYVQHKLKQQGEQVFAWLEKGAHFYVCGDMSKMAKDVHQALVEIIIEHGGKSEQQAEDYLKQLRINKRYQKDVY